MGSPRNAALKEVPPDPGTEWFNFDHPCRGRNRIVDADDGRVDLLMPDGSAPRRKIALIGFATSTRQLAPLDDPDWAVVGMNQLQRHLRHPVVKNGEVMRGSDGEPVTVLRHADLWFEVHKVWNTAVVPGTDHKGWLEKCDMPVFMTDRVPGIDTSVRYPVERLIEKFDIDYFTSTVAYMFAWAIDHIDGLVAKRLQGRKPTDMEAARELLERTYSEYAMGVFGIDLIVGEEYEDQRPCAEFWLGEALARGIEVVVPRQSALLSQRYRYGYDVETPGLIRASDLDERLKQLEAEHARFSERAINLHGRVAELEALPESVLGAAGGQVADRLEELRAQHVEASERVVSLHGQVNEARYWKHLHQLRDRGMNS